MTEKIPTDILVVGDSTGGTTAAIQAARCGVKTVLVTELAWLGGMLTTAGVSAPDGNELAAWQTGIWGEYLRSLQQRQPGGLDNAWVSMFTYHPRIGAEILANWVEELPNLKWIVGYVPVEVYRQQNRIIGVRFASKPSQGKRLTDFIVEAKITIDGTELGDLLALGEIPHRWGWEMQTEFKEPSAPIIINKLTTKYPIQAPTWVFILQKYDRDRELISSSPSLPLSLSCFNGAWDNYGADNFLNYGRLPGNRYMINWPICGNDYGNNLGRLIESKKLQQEFLQEAYHHSLDFAGFIQSQLGKSYGLAKNIFSHSSINNSAFALHPYYRESRRLIGKVTITENDILPVKNGCVAQLPINTTGEVSSIAIGNYPNDHHYPGVEFALQPKSLRWGGRWTGTPFTIPYDALWSENIENLLVCEKNISVSHIANGSTRLQPVVMNIGQAAGMAAALCIKFNCQPIELPVRKLQEALLTDKFAPAAVVPLFNLPPEHPEWLKWQKYYLDHPEEYPENGNCPSKAFKHNEFSFLTTTNKYYQGIFYRRDEQKYEIVLTEPLATKGQTWQLVTLQPEVDKIWLDYQDKSLVSVVGRCNYSGGWLLVEKMLKR
ncbi:MAG: FAD-dependent oxidoreductase [Xenococcaceae cyanobacterium MO_188.B32]|nr:FAD-dependent oxidoreductase [Xenococcaceae cyanobacterium MO_188.B32]